MSDEFLDLFNDHNSININVTPNIELHLDKTEFSNHLKNKFIGENYLFARPIFIDRIKNIMLSNCDVPIIVYGLSGIGKLTTCIGLLNYLPFNIDNPINNLDYFKPYDHNYTKLLCLDTVFYLNLIIFNNDTEIMDYIKCIYKIAITRSLTDEKRYFIIKGLDTVSPDILNFVKYMLDRLNAFSSFIFIVHRLNYLPKKILNTCAKIHFPHLIKEEFDEIFKISYKHKFKYLEWLVAPKFYNLYENNNFNIGHTINQIRYLQLSNNINSTFFKNPDNLVSLDTLIAQHFLKNYLILSSIEKIGEIRKFVYNLLSINYPIIIFIKNLCKCITKSKLSHNKKMKIFEKMAYFSKIYNSANKEVIPIEGLLFNIIDIIYS